MADLTSRNYDKTLVSYIDVLGFKDIPEKRGSEEVFQVLGKMKWNLESGGRVHYRNDEIIQIYKSFNFSDLIVRATRVEADADFGKILDWELFHLSENQLFLALEGILVRGGLSVGNLFIDPKASIVFGPAMVKSYKLESEYAVYPRIVMDRDLVWEAEETGSIAQWRDFCSRGEDGAYFVNYLFGGSLTGLLVGRPGEEPDARQRIRAHRDMIVDFIVNHIRSQTEQVPERVKQKWIWLALYHNSTIQRLKKRFQPSPNAKNFDEFLIAEHFLRF